MLPLYFKHSNFSSFARQLNFYGFRKLRSDPILTTDADPQTSLYVRFYHEKFQKDKPELLHEIRRATKSDQQKTDNEVESLKREVQGLKDALETTVHEFNRRLNQTNAEFEKLVQCFIAQQRNNETSAAAAALTELPGAPHLYQPHIAAACAATAASMLQQSQQQQVFQQHGAPMDASCVERMHSGNHATHGAVKRKASDDGSGSGSSHPGDSPITRPRLS